MSLDPKSLAVGGGVPTLFFFSILYYIIRNPGKFDIWLSKLQWLIAYVFKSYKYSAQAREIEGNINSLATTLGKDSGLEFTKAKVHWIANDKEQQVVWGDGEVILVMRDRGAKNRNLAHSVYFFTSKTWLLRLKNHLSEAQKSTLDVYTTSKLLEAMNKSASLYFSEDFFVPLVEKKNLKEIVKKLETIDTSGFYFTILLQELAYLGATVILDKADAKIAEEVNDLIKFLVSFSEREVGDESSRSDFVGKYTRCGIKIVAAASTRNRGNIERPAARIQGAFTSGIEDIYVIGPYEEGKAFINSVCDWLCNQDEGVKVEVIRRTKTKSQIKHHGVSVTTQAYLVHLQRSGALRKTTLRDRDIANMQDDLSDGE